MRSRAAGRLVPESRCQRCFSQVPVHPVRLSAQAEEGRPRPDGDLRRRPQHPPGQSHQQLMRAWRESTRSSVLAGRAAGGGAAPSLRAGSGGCRTRAEAMLASTFSRPAPERQRRLPLAQGWGRGGSQQSSRGSTCGGGGSSRRGNCWSAPAVPRPRGAQQERRLLLTARAWRGRSRLKPSIAVGRPKLP